MGHNKEKIMALLKSIIYMYRQFEKHNGHRPISDYNYEAWHPVSFHSFSSVFPSTRHTYLKKVCDCLCNNCPDSSHVYENHMVAVIHHSYTLCNQATICFSQGRYRF